MGILLPIIIAVLVLLMLLIVFVSKYQTAKPDEALIISGSYLGSKNVHVDEGGNKIKIVRGGGAFVLPVFQRSNRISLLSSKLDVSTPEVYTEQGVPVMCDGTSIIKIGSSVEEIATAAEQFLGKTTEELENEAREVLEGHLRSILGSMTVEEIYQNRDKFSQSVQEVASVDLAKMGLVIVSFTIKEVRDKNGYLDSLGKPRIAQVKRDADIAEAEALKETRIKKAEAEKEETGAAGPVDFLKRYPSFAVVLLGCILIFMSHSLINSFNYQIAMAKGGGSGEMGNAMTISAVSELPTMFLFGYLLKKKSSVFWFRLSGLFFVLKSIGTFLAFNIPTYYAAQPFQMFGWALINVACVYYVNGIMEPQDSIKGQAYMAMTITAGNVMSSLFGGWLIDAAGVGAMLICASLAAFIGWLIVCLGSKEAKTA